MDKMGKALSLLLVIAIFSCLVVYISNISTEKTVKETNNTKILAYKTSALGYIESIELYAEVNKFNELPDDDINDGVYTIDDLKTKNVSFRGMQPSDGWVKIKEDKVIECSLQLNDGYVANKDSVDSDIKLEKNGKLKEMPNE